MSFFEYLSKNPVYVIIVCVAFALCIVAALIKYPLLNVIKRKTETNQESVEDTVEKDDNQLNSLVENENADEKSSEEQGE